MAAQQQVHNLKSASAELHEQVCEQLLVTIVEATDANAMNADSVSADSAKTANRKKKIVLIGPEIDRLASHVRWGNRLSSSFYRTVGLNISLRTVTTKTPIADVDIDFVVWQLSSSLNPSLQKNLMRGASALIVAVGDAVGTGDTSNNKTESQNVSQNASQTVDDSGATHYYAEKKSDYSWSNSEAAAIAMLDESAKQLKLPIAFIHFVEDEANKPRISIDNQQALKEQGLKEDSYSNDSSTDNCIVKLHETEHSLHLGLMSVEDSEICLCKAFDYIAEHFASTI